MSDRRLLIAAILLWLISSMLLFVSLLLTPSQKQGALSRILFSDETEWNRVRQYKQTMYLLTAEDRNNEPVKLRNVEVDPFFIPLSLIMRTEKQHLTIEKRAINSLPEVERIFRVILDEEQTALLDAIRGALGVDITTAVDRMTFGARNTLLGGNFDTTMLADVLTRAGYSKITDVQLGHYQHGSEHVAFSESLLFLGEESIIAQWSETLAGKRLLAIHEAEESDKGEIRGILSTRQRERLLSCDLPVPVRALLTKRSVEIKVNVRTRSTVALFLTISHVRRDDIESIAVFLAGWREEMKEIGDKTGLKDHLDLFRISTGEDRYHLTMALPDRYTRDWLKSCLKAE